MGGKPSFGGQNLVNGVWRLKDMCISSFFRKFTVKSDDVAGRAKTYESIVKGENLQNPNVPEAFNVLIKEMQGLGLDIKIN